MKIKFSNLCLVALFLILLTCFSSVIFLQKSSAAPMNCKDITTRMLERAGRMEMSLARKSTSSTDSYCAWDLFSLGNSKELVDIHFYGAMSTSTPISTQLGSLKTLTDEDFGCQQGAIVNDRRILVRARNCSQAQGILRFLVAHQRP